MPMQVGNSSIIELLPGRLGWAPEAQNMGAATNFTPALDFCWQAGEKDSKVGVYHVHHYPVSANGRAFGPLGLDSLICFCRGLEAKLEGRLPEEGPLVVSAPAGDVEYRANAAVLLGSYLCLRFTWSTARIAKSLGARDADMKFACSWARRGCPEPPRVLSVRHCWQGVEVARQHGWITRSFMYDSVEAEKACRAYGDMVSRFDAAWIIPGEVMVGADPTTVICDPNPITCQQFLPDACQGDMVDPSVISEIALNGTDKLSVTASTTGSPADVDSCDTVCKDYTTWAGEPGSETADAAGAGESCGYTDDALGRYGICHAKIPVVDKNGGLPQPADVARILRLCDDPGDAVMVHCKGGFGRSVVLACCLAISRLDVSGEALLGWVRIVRPGAFTVTAQEAFMKSLRGRRDVLRYAKMPCVGEDPGSVSLSCGMPCRVQ